MRLKLLLPHVEPSVFEEPGVCRYEKCGGKQFHLRQEVRKAVRDTVYTEVTARRYDCLRCGRTFRVYPLGINDDQTSRRLKGLAVLFYLMGLSYGAVALVLTALGHSLSKTAVYDAVQAAGAKVTGLRRDAVQVSTAQLLLAALGAAVTSVQCKGEWLTVGVTTDALTGTTLTSDLLDNGEADTLPAWLAAVAGAVQAEVRVTDDADGFKTAADANGLQHQVCKKQLLHHSAAWHEAIAPELARAADGSRAAIGVPPQQALADTDALRRLMQERPPTPEANAMREEIHGRYAQACSLRKLGQDAETLAYRMRCLAWIVGISGPA